MFRSAFILYIPSEGRVNDDIESYVREKEFEVQDRRLLRIKRYAVQGNRGFFIVDQTQSDGLETLFRAGTLNGSFVAAVFQGKALGTEGVRADDRLERRKRRAEVHLGVGRGHRHYHLRVSRRRYLFFSAFCQSRVVCSVGAGDCDAGEKDVDKFFMIFLF